MSDAPSDGMAIVVKALLFTSVVLVLVGVYMLLRSSQPLIGALVIGAGVLDGLMALGLSKRS